MTEDQDHLFPKDCYEITLNAPNPWQDLELLPRSPSCNETRLVPEHDNAPQLILPGWRIEVIEPDGMFVKCEKPDKHVVTGKLVALKVRLLDPDGAVVSDHPPLTFKASLLYEDMSPAVKMPGSCHLSIWPFQTCSVAMREMKHGVCEFSLFIDKNAGVYSSKHDQKKFRFHVDDVSEQYHKLAAASSAFVIASKGDRTSRARVARTTGPPSQNLALRVEQLVQRVEEQQTEIAALRNRVTDLEGAQNKKRCHR